jgi:glycosyltransferase involved in cell wall biosynthesis
MNFYSEADAALVPLVGSEFNSMKSNLKVLEAACKKIPVIASDVSPYKECPHVLKVSKQGDWYKHIKTLAKSESLRKTIGTANYEWATENHNLHKWNEVREQLFKSLI